MERTIRVTGKGKISVTPDLIRLTITQSGTEKTHEEAIKESSVQKQDLNDALSNIGFRKEDLKTTYFNVNTEYNEYRDKYSGDWKRDFQGYKFTHTMKLEFPISSNKLGVVLGVVASCTGAPVFTIQYTISDPEKAKNELLANAVRDCKVKASILTNAAGVTLKQIETIDYSWGEIDFVREPVDRLYANECADMCESGSIDLDIEPDDITVTDTVTMVWSVF